MDIKGQSRVEVIESGIIGKRVQVETPKGSKSFRVLGPATIKIIKNGSYHRCECGSDMYLRDAFASKTTCKHCKKDHSAVASLVELAELNDFGPVDIPEPRERAITGNKGNQGLDCQPVSTPITLKSGLLLLGLVVGVLGATYVAIMYF